MTTTTEKIHRRTEPSTNGHAEAPAPTWTPCRWALPPIPAGAMVERLFTPSSGSRVVVLGFAPDGDAGPQVAYARHAKVAGAARAAELEAARAGLARALDARDIPKLAAELAVAEKEAAVARARLAQAVAGAEVAEIDPSAAPGAAEALRAAEEAVKRSVHRRDALREDLARRRGELADAARESAEAAVTATEREAVAEIEAALAIVAGKIGAELERLDEARRRGPGHPQARAQVIDQLVQALVAEAERGGA
jgi:hypothetical protein